MKIIIAGDGKVGATLARQLSAEGHDLTLIDARHDVLASTIERYDVMTITGNCATMGVLRQAEVESANLLIAVTNADEVNLLCCMTAHAMNPRLHTMARIRNPEYAEQIFQMRDQFALSMMFNPEKQTAIEIERLLEFPGFLKRESFAKDRVEIVELRVEAGGKLDGVSLSDLDRTIGCKVLVCTVLREGRAVMPGGSFVLRAGDCIFVTAATSVLSTLLKNLGIISRKPKRVILVGGGRVSYYLAQRLNKAGMRVSILEKERARCVELAGLLPETDIIHGDASDQRDLDSAGLSECDAIVSLTGLDEVNIIISLYATSRKVPHVITKLGHGESLDILDKLPIGSVVCPKELSCNTVVRYVRAIEHQAGAAVSVHTIANGQAEAVEFIVDEDTRHVGVPLKNLTLRKNVLLVCITRGVTTQIPDGDSTLEVGDTVVAVTGSDTVLLQLNDIFA